MEYNEIPKEELVIVSDKMIGIVLMNAMTDSNGDRIDPNKYYHVEKHIPTGRLIIFPQVSDFNKEFTNKIMNGLMKKKGKLN